MPVLSPRIWQGASWEQIGAAAGSITKQAAHGRWAEHVNAWAAQGSTVGFGGRMRALDAAASLNLTHHRRDPDNHPSDAFSSGLDAVRFPGAEAAELACRERVASLRAPGRATEAARCRRGGVP
ncbi:hypothetical protein ACWDG9_17035 [Streptomyces sp. NPDC001073]